MIDFFDMSFHDQPLDRSKRKPEAKKERNKTIEQPQHTMDLSPFKSLRDLHLYLKNIHHPLRDTCKSAVLYSGALDSPLMIIGEAPGALEDERATPFVGDSGVLLNQLLSSVGIDRDKVYVTNLVFFRPPMNRKPTTEEIDFFWPILQKQIELQNPKVILALGATAACKFTPLPITKARGSFETYNSIPIFFSFHPSFLLRMQNMKAIAQQDFETLKNFLVQNNYFQSISA